MASSNLKSFFYALSAVLFWSTAATAFKLTLRGINHIQIVFYASAASTIIFLLIFLFSKKSGPTDFFTAKNVKKNILLGFTNPFLHYIVLLKAYSIMPANEMIPLNYTWPIAITIFAAIFLKSKLTYKSFIGMIAAFIGVIIIATRGDLFSMHFENLFGVTLALCTPIIWATYWTLSLLDKRDDISKLFGSFFFGTIFIGIYVGITDTFILSDFRYLIGTTYIGLFEMGITFFLWMKGLQLSTDKAKTATLVYLSPFISLILVAIFLDETIYQSSIIGLLFIIGGILFQHVAVIRDEKNHKIRLKVS